MEQKKGLELGEKYLSISLLGSIRLVAFKSIFHNSKRFLRMAFDCSLAFEKGLCNSDCCGPVPIPKDIWEKVKAKAMRPFKLLEIKGEVVPEPVIGLTCVFLENKRCTIYNDRPEICRDYGINQWLPCPFLKANGHLRSFANHKRTQRQINHSVDDCLACIQRRALCQ